MVGARPGDLNVDAARIVLGVLPAGKEGNELLAHDILARTEAGWDVEVPVDAKAVQFIGPRDLFVVDRFGGLEHLVGGSEAKRAHARVWLSSGSNQAHLVNLGELQAVGRPR